MPRAHRPIEVEQKQPPKNFWKGKTPCWVLRHCISEAREQCNAYRNQSLPCWEQETLCKGLCGGSTCFVCEVFIKYVGTSDD